MIPIVRIYPSEQQAREAAENLEEVGFTDVVLLEAAPVASQAAAAVRDAVAEERIPGSHLRICTKSLEQGRSIVAVRAPFGRGELASQILASAGPVDVDLLPPYQPRNPAPFSDLFGIPVLAKFTPMTDLSIITYSFGEPSLSGRKAAPLSSLLGLRTLTTPKRPWKSSLGLPLLSRDPAPLSSLLRWKPLSGYRRKDSSFGLPLLSRNPTPLSSLFGMRVLSRKKRAKTERD